MRAEPDTALPLGKRGLALPRGLVLPLCLASVAPAVAWLAYILLGLRLQPNHWTGWSSGLFAWVWVLALAPVLEETALRPLLQTGLRYQFGRIEVNDRLHSSLDWRGHLANVATALAFVVLHLPANGALAVWWLAPAVAIGEVWRRSASWWLCVLLHAWFNASLLVVTAFSSLG